MARSDVKVPFASVWILLSYSDSSERFCRSWKALARTQWILLAFSNLARKKQRVEEVEEEGSGRREEEGGREGGKQPVRVSLCAHSLCIPSRKPHRYKVYFKGTTSSLSRSIECACVSSGLQQLQGVEAVKHPLGQVGDLISIQHAGKTAKWTWFRCRSDKPVMYAQTQMHHWTGPDLVC